MDGLLPIASGRLVPEMTPLNDYQSWLFCNRDGKRYLNEET
ncbi:hypothetical protein [Pandoraea terrae]|nr:hypothetical protein [Pandoraea terrae]